MRCVAHVINSLCNRCRSFWWRCWWRRRAMMRSRQQWKQPVSRDASKASSATRRMLSSPLISSLLRSAPFLTLKPVSHSTRTSSSWSHGRPLPDYPVLKLTVVTVTGAPASLRGSIVNASARILFTQTLALYKSFTYLLSRWPNRFKHLVLESKQKNTKYINL